MGKKQDCIVNYKQRQIYSCTNKNTLGEWERGGTDKRLRKVGKGLLVQYTKVQFFIAVNGAAHSTL